METTCPSLHLDWLGELEYADESWFNEDSNISVPVSACWCYRDGSLPGFRRKYLKSGLCSSWHITGIPRMSYAIRPSAKVNSTWIFFPSPSLPGHLRNWSPWCCPWQVLSVFAKARARCQPSKNRTTQAELHQHKINMSCSNQIKVPQQLQAGRATHPLSMQTCEPEPKEKQDLATLIVPLWIMTGLTRKRLS